MLLVCWSVLFIHPVHVTRCCWLALLNILPAQDLVCLCANVIVNVCSSLPLIGYILEVLSCVLVLVRLCCVDMSLCVSYK